jgi:cytochrome c peroxidase
MEELMDFYNSGGGLGKGLSVSNQTLSSDSLHLSKSEINNLIAFMKSLNEDFKTPKQPKLLPVSSNTTLNHRKPGGHY